MPLPFELCAPLAPQGALAPSSSRAARILEFAFGEEMTKVAATELSGAVARWTLTAAAHKRPLRARIEWPGRLPSQRQSSILSFNKERDMKIIKGQEVEKEEGREVRGPRKTFENTKLLTSQGRLEES